MWRVIRRIIILSSVTLSVCCCLARAADLAYPDPGAQPRFAVNSPRLQPASGAISVDSRFHLEWRLQTAPDNAQHGTAVALRARLIDSVAAVCGADVIFANGFE